jgi:hypothetical protein
MRRLYISPTISCPPRFWTSLINSPERRDEGQVHSIHAPVVFTPHASDEYTPVKKLPIRSRGPPLRSGRHLLDLSDLYDLVADAREVDGVLVPTLPSYGGPVVACLSVKCMRSWRPFC